MAHAELALGFHSEAALHFQACLKGRPDDVRAWRDYLAMLLEQGDLDAFTALLQKAPHSADSEPETWMYRGVAREKAGDRQAAANHFRKAIELNPTAPKYYYRLAMAEERLGLREQAAAHRGRTKQMNEARSQLAGRIRGLLRSARRQSSSRTRFAKRLQASRVDLRHSGLVSGRPGLEPPGDLALNEFSRDHAQK